MALDPNALLCERCGYHLAGLEREAKCPECGTPIGESLPTRRVGSSWQRAPTPAAWIETVALPFRHPIGMWDAIRVERGHVDGLAFSVKAVAAMIPAVALLIESYDGLGAGLLLLLGFVGLTLASVIEQRGIRFFGRNHRWRITEDVAFVVCAHAMPGWLVGSVALAGLILIQVDASIWVIPACALLGLLCFETLVYIGMRRMKFANSPGAMPARNPGGSEPESGGVRIDGVGE